MTKSFKSNLNRFNSDLWHFYLMVPLDVSAHFNGNDMKRLLCTLNGKEEFQCALMPHGDNQYFINVNKERRKKLKLNLGDEVQVVLKEDESEYGLPMPEEFGELLRLDDEGNKLFHGLTPGKQRSLLFILGKPKASDTRLAKAVVLLEYLKSTAGKLNFRDLNEAFRKKE